MLDSFSLWLHETAAGEALLTMLISMLPVVELRGWIRVHIPKLGGLVSRLENRAKVKSADVLRYQTWGLLIFVAIPLPGTGAWTGALIAAVLDMRLKRAVPVIFLGVVIAGCIITLLTHGVTLLF